MSLGTWGAVANEILVCNSWRRRTDFREGVRYDGCGGCG
jgi:hypothetical protein